MPKNKNSDKYQKFLELLLIEYLRGEFVQLFLIPLWDFQPFWGSKSSRKLKIFAKLQKSNFPTLQGKALFTIFLCARNFAKITQPSYVRCECYLDFFVSENSSIHQKLRKSLKNYRSRWKETKNWIQTGFFFTARSFKFFFFVRPYLMI